jgi:dTDP-4-dehydrorhamnose 3,5-epimerase-like enzyme
VSAPHPAPPGVGIQSITDVGDHRGSSFSIPEEWTRFLPSAVDLHITTLRPGHVRGNHFHRTRKEVIVVLHSDGWTLHWDSGGSGGILTRAFAGGGAVLLTVEPGAAHAIVNSGTRDLHTFGLTDGRYDPGDTVARELARPSQG